MIIYRRLSGIMHLNKTPVVYLFGFYFLTLKDITCVSFLCIKCTIYLTMYYILILLSSESCIVSYSLSIAIILTVTQYSCLILYCLHIFVYHKTSNTFKHQASKTSYENNRSYNVHLHFNQSI